MRFNGESFSLTFVVYWIGTVAGVTGDAVRGGRWEGVQEGGGGEGKWCPGASGEREMKIH